MKGWKSIEVPKHPDGSRMTRAEVFDTSVFRNAWKLMQRTMEPRKRCVHGHDLTKLDNIDTAAVLWEGKPGCYACWKKTNEKYLAKQAKAGKPALTKKQAPANFGGKADRDIVSLIAKRVAASTLANAQMVPAAQTREQFFSQITNGVREGMRAYRAIGFHAPVK